MPNRPAPDSQTQSDPAQTEAGETKPFLVDLAGYLSFRYITRDDLAERDFYREYAASVFLSKTIGRWRFHAELNANTAPEYDADGIHLLPPHPSMAVKLDSGFVNYNFRDWLQVQAGFLFIPTYWRMHRYQSTTLTVDEPLIDQNIFPTAFKGAQIYGDKYFREGGISYFVYGGADQLSEYRERTQAVTTEGASMVGAKLTVHLPSRQFFSTFDVSVHRLHRSGPDNIPDDLYGVEMQLAKGRFEALAEFDHASMDVLNGVPKYIREGYYVQPTYRITRKWFAVALFDRLNRNSLYADQSGLIRQSAGVTYRPVPAVSLKLEGVRFEPQGSRMPAFYGVNLGAVYFFHRP